ncbi:hypothetical protein PSACC_02175 [Paramicrosporidium saccamoebae]|uniref:Uncharacterized protein n=1 Tax=Paramicrosporidium saccamoebae TaxID=1246581 RepID=A0A2H9TJV2_9FUNG|nr:hypothetical protein PSACC_02175 [Paramicrosporidium saccamoebae]
MWCQNELAASDKRRMKYLLESRTVAQNEGQLEWWMHFDWLAWRHGYPNVLRESLQLLVGPEYASHRLYILILLSYFDESLVLSELEPALLAMEPSSEAVSLIATLMCLKERIQRGESDHARRFYERNTGMIPSCNGILPGFIRLHDPTLIGTVWARLAATLSLRLGEAPTNIITLLLPELQHRFESMNAGSEVIDTKNAYAEKRKQLLGLMESIQTDPGNALVAVQDLQGSLDPQLESFRLVICALCMHRLNHPVHHTKGTLLTSLKMLNSCTQNAQLKIIVLLLVGRLYLDTDFAMSAKMSAAAFGCAQTARWEVLEKAAAGLLSKAKRLLGDTDEAQKYALLAE